MLDNFLSDAKLWLALPSRHSESELIQLSLHYQTRSSQVNLGIIYHKHSGRWISSAVNFICKIFNIAISPYSSLLFICKQCNGATQVRLDPTKSLSTNYPFTTSSVCCDQITPQWTVTDDDWYGKIFIPDNKLYIMPDPPSSLQQTGALRSHGIIPWIHMIHPSIRQYRSGCGTVSVPQKNEIHHFKHITKPPVELASSWL